MHKLRLRKNYNFVEFGKKFYCNVSADTIQRNTPQAKALFATMGYVAEKQLIKKSPFIKEYLLQMLITLRS